MSPHGDNLDLGVILDRPMPGHVCQPPVRDHMMRPPSGPAIWPSIGDIRDLIAAGCTHYVLLGDTVSRAGDPWETPCPVHVPPKASKVDTMAAEPIGTLWRCHDCGTVWIVDKDRPPPMRGGYVSGGPPQWYRATRRQRRAARPSFRARLIARLRGA